MQTYPSPDDIQQMKQRGYDRVIIADAEETLCLWQMMKDIQTQIEQAFANVTLGDGIGLWQAQGIDDYKTATECHVLRQRDETLDWTNIPTQDLNDCNSSLSFFDAAGMRFYLPAFLLADLRGEWRFNLIFHLCELSNDKQQKFALLNQVQRDAVRAYLTWIASDSDFELHRNVILKTLNDGDWSA